ncbi:MAG: peptidase-C39 like family protein [Legionella sp.]|nr:MAG: peptidase-C39 like family protein [Legionella sp.]PJD98811.1 MAG: peptidase-C39 like family protein [Legionella sp.]
MIEIVIQVQPDDETCGPTSLHAIYQYYGFKITLDEVIQTVERSISGGTLSPMLGKHAQERGFNTKIYIYNLNIFDPTWFKHTQGDNQYLIDKLEAQMEVKDDIYIHKESIAYVEYLKQGGTICFQSLNVDLLKKYFARQVPILTALSATYLYRSMREVFTLDSKSIYDDIRGTPCGHFVVLCGYDAKKRSVVVADPHPTNPLFNDNYYKVSVNRLINSIMLGVLTYDANLLIIEPKES